MKGEFSILLVRGISIVRFRGEGGISFLSGEGQDSPFCQVEGSLQSGDSQVEGRDLYSVR